MKTLSFVLALARLPFDILLLTYHWIKGTLFLLWDFVCEMFELPKAKKWPFRNFTSKTSTGHYSCLPAKKYGNPKLFKMLCPDLSFDHCNNCICNQKMYEENHRWRPSWFRVGFLGLALCTFWIGVDIVLEQRKDSRTWQVTSTSSYTSIREILISLVLIRLAELYLI